MTDVLAAPGGDAPGRPGVAPTWTSSAKDMVGCALGRSRVWFTTGFGILNEVYYPRVDSPQIRDLGFVVADGNGFWVEVKRLENYTIRLLAPGTPAVEIVHTHARFTLSLRVTPDPDRDVLLVSVALVGDAALKPYVLLAPRLGMSGRENTATVRTGGGRRLLAAEAGPLGLALAAVDADGREAFCQTSVGYVGESDGWQDFNRNGAMIWRYASAGPGNVALMAELTRTAVLGLGFGDSAQAAGTLAVSALLRPFDDAVKRQIDDWQKWHAHRDEHALMRTGDAAELAEPLALSAMVLRTHRDKTYPGSMVASLSVPWGNSRDDLGGYHLVWPRDLVQCATALLALGAEQEARDTLAYLVATQKPDGSWNQNQWLDGTPYWTGVQLDETAFPVLLAAALADRNALRGLAVGDMVTRALGFIARTGPSSSQDRWEEDAGIGAYTLSVSIAALVAGASFLSEDARKFALVLADFWNANIEAWTSIMATPMANQLGVEGYYVRVAPADILSDPASLQQSLAIKNQEPGRTVPADEQISVDFLQLVRMGLRLPDDPLIRDSVAVVDALLKVDTPSGPTWHRYNGDGYGEHDDGRPFDGTGRGRAWPLLTGERGCYALAAGDDPMPYLKAMAAMTGPAGMMPEQVWDDTAMPDRRLWPGRPTGSAMPLAWAHAEFIKLMVSRHMGYSMDRPQSVWQRYAGIRPKVARAIWSQHAPIGNVRRGDAILIALNQSARVRWTVDGWRNSFESQTVDTGVGLQVVEVAGAAISGTPRLDFTFQATGTGEPADREFHIAVAD